MRGRDRPYRGGMSDANPLGEFLRARRALVRPEDAGVVVTGVRRTPGLRREEVATLAGISADYYLRLEQGRDTHPSPQVLDALSRVLQLSTDAASHLHALASGAPRRPQQNRPERVPAGVEQLIDELSVPTFVQGRFMDVLAANSLARALSPHYRPGANLLQAVFLDPADQELHQDWHRATEEAVSGLRALTGPDLDDPRLTELVGELSLASERFRQLWARQDVRRKVGGVSHMLHPVVGPLELRHQKFAITGTDGQIMVMYHAEPGSPSQEALRRLANLTSSGVVRTAQVLAP